MQNFDDKENWTGGPTFDLTLITEECISGTAISELLLASGRFSLYSGSPSERGMRSIFEAKHDLKFPVRHWHYWSTYSTPCSYYNLCMRTKVFENFVGSPPDDVSQIQDPSNLLILLNAFIEIVFIVKSQFGIEYATIANENDGRAHPDWRDDLKGLYISTSICKVLQIPSVRVDTSDLSLSNSFISVLWTS